MFLVSARALRTLVLALALATATRADWEGTLKLKVDPPPRGGEPPQDGKIAAKGTRLRFDMSRPGMGQAAVIFDYKAKKATMIMEERKAFMIMDVDREGPPGRAMARPLAFCETAEAQACLEKNGFKRAGSDHVNGWKATKWVREREADGQKSHDELWTPEGFKEFALLRQVTKSGERTMSLDVLDLKRAEQPESRFQVPAGYQDMSGMMKGMGPGMGPGGRPGRPPGLPPPPPPGGQQ